MLFLLALDHHEHFISANNPFLVHISWNLYYNLSTIYQSQNVNVHENVNFKPNITIFMK